MSRISDDEQDAGAAQRDLDRWRRERARAVSMGLGTVDGSQGSIYVSGILETSCDPTRVLAECEAKRAIVESEVSPYPRGHAPATRVLRILAAVYSDHADYRDEWRP